MVREDQLEKDKGGHKAAMEKPPQQQTEPTEEGEEEDHTSRLPDDILVGILSLCGYDDAVRTASVSRRWERLVAQLPDLTLCLSILAYTTAIGTPCERRLRSLACTLRRRCRDGAHPVRTLQLVYRKDVPMECRHVDDFIALAHAQKLVLHAQWDTDVVPADGDADSDDDEAAGNADDTDENAGAWSLELPPATTELKVVPYSYEVRPPHIHGAGVGTLRSLALVGFTVLRQDFLLTSMPSLEDLHIGDCTLPDSIEVTSAAMPRLKHLRITEVSVMTEEITRAGISVLADELRTLRMSCHMCSSTKPTSAPEMRCLNMRFSASFTSYSCFRLRAPRLSVFEWRCCYADEVRVDSVGRLSDVAVEIAAGRKPMTYRQECRYVTVQQRDKLMTDILHALMPGLQPRSWENVKGKCMQREHDDRWLRFEITSACSTANH
ncbi:unnamed protein product [Urochloa decumbens]|uniref:F-box domain-containing protein n=1 Tax=Urochloa decumbens TaxID=240449 RepID=A0ABC9DIU7_9POAL